MILSKFLNLNLKFFEKWLCSICCCLKSKVAGLPQGQKSQEKLKNGISQEI